MLTANCVQSVKKVRLVSFRSHLTFIYSNIHYLQLYIFYFSRKSTCKQIMAKCIRTYIYATGLRWMVTVHPRSVTITSNHLEQVGHCECPFSSTVRNFRKRFHCECANQNASGQLVLCVVWLLCELMTRHAPTIHHCHIKHTPLVTRMFATHNFIYTPRFTNLSAHPVNKLHYVFNSIVSGSILYQAIPLNDT